MKKLILLAVLMIGSIAFADRDCRLQGPYECHGDGQNFYLDFSAPSHHITKMYVSEVGSCQFTAQLPLDPFAGSTNGICDGSPQAITYQNASCDQRNVNVEYSEVTPSGITKERIMSIAPLVPDNSNGISPRPVLLALITDIVDNTTSANPMQVICTPNCGIPTFLPSDRIFADGFEGIDPSCSN